MKKVLGMGNALVDIMIQLRNDEILNQFDIPKASMQLVDNNLSEEIIDATKSFPASQSSGGSAANTIHGLAKLGVNTGFIGRVGRDDFGDFFEKDMINSGIQPELDKSTTRTGQAIAMISPDSERTFATFLGAAVELNADNLKVDSFIGYDYFHIEGYLLQNHELIEKAIDLAKNAGAKISIDLASFNVVEDNLDFLKRIITEKVDIVFANEEESKAFTGKNPEDALNEIAAICEIAIVKIGKDGSLIKKGNNSYKINPIDAIRKDTTGAGDLYAAGFLYGLIKEESLEECGRIGTILSSKVIEVIGAKLDDSKWISVQEMIAEK